MTTILAFDTATSFGAVCALTPGRRAHAERAGDLLAAVDALVDDPAAIEAIVVGRGPGSFTSIRIGLAIARSLALALGVPVAGASTLDAFAGGTPVIDARRGEVFTPGPRVCRPEELDVAGQTLVGDGAIRYRELFEARGADGPAGRRPGAPARPAAARRARRRFGAAAARRAALRPRPRREAERMTAVAIEIRILGLTTSTRSRRSSSRRTRRRGRARCSRPSSRSRPRSASARSRARTSSATSSTRATSTRGT